MKKLKFFIPFLVGGLILTGCKSASDLEDNFSDEDLVIDTPWEDFVMPAIGVEFAGGEESIELNKGETHSYKYEIQPRGATSNSLTWTSSDPEVATVSDGVVTAVGGGEATITLGGFDDSTINIPELSVKVNVPLVDFSLNIPDRLDWDESYSLTPTFEPEDTTYTDLKYEIVSGDDLLTISESGVATTFAKNGTAKIKVTSEFLGEAKAKEYDVSIQTIPVQSIVLSNKDNINEVEIKSSLPLEASVTPSDASDYVKKGIKFYSEDPSIATVDEVTGTVTGVKAGTAHIYGQVGSKKSEVFEVSVFEVHATAVEFITPSVELVNYGATQDDIVLEKQLEWAFTTDKAGYTKPSNATIRFESDDETVVTVSEAGVVKAIGAGNASVSIIVEQEGKDPVSTSINASVDFRSTSLSITGGTSFYNDESLTLNATLAPSSVTDPTISWTLDSEDVAVLSSDTGSSVTLLPADEDAKGDVVVTATNGEGAKSSVTISVAERNLEFAEGQHYIVGNNLYNTGRSVSKENKSSWDTVKYAYHFTNAISTSSEANLKQQFKGTIYFRHNDEFKYRVGPNYIPAYEQYEESRRGYHIEDAGAMTDGSMHYINSDDPTSNIIVDHDGWYDLYAKHYENEGSTWYGLYIQQVPAMSAETTELTMGVEDTYQIVLHDYIGEVTYGVTSDVAIEVSDTGLITAKAVGTSTVVVHDERGEEVLIHVEVKDGAAGVSKTIYLNANAKLDNGTTFVYSWNHSDTAAYVFSKMSLVSDQENVFEASVPIEHDYVIFVDCSQAQFDWAAKIAQTTDLAFVDGKDMFTAKYTNDEGKYVGEWSVFDPLTHYEIDAPYIFYNNGEWARARLKDNPADQNELMGSVDLVAGAEFVVCISDSSWAHYENLKSGSASEIVEGEDGETGHNFKTTLPGTYTLYVNKTSKEVYVGFKGHFNVSYNANGGTGEMATVEDQSGKYTVLENGFTAPEGKIFEGWRVDNSGDLIHEGAEYQLKGDVTFYAQWHNPYVYTKYYMETKSWFNKDENDHLYLYAFNSEDESINNAEFPGVDVSSGYVQDIEDGKKLFELQVADAYDTIILSKCDNSGEKVYQTQNISLTAPEMAGKNTIYLKSAEGDNAAVGFYNVIELDSYAGTISKSETVSVNVSSKFGGVQVTKPSDVTVSLSGNTATIGAKENGSYEITFTDAKGNTAVYNLTVHDHSYDSESHECSCGALHPDYVKVLFTCKYNTYGDGDIYIYGIGGWEAEHRIKLNCEGDDWWTIELTLKKGEQIGFKAVRSHKDSDTLDWEKDGTGNERKFTPESSCTYEIKWGNY